MKIAVIGAGYVGLVSGACFSEFGHQVVCVDNDAAKIATLAAGEVPIYEPGLEALLCRNTGAGRLKFATDIAPAVIEADVVFIAVGTPARRGDGHADLRFVHAVARDIAVALPPGRHVLVVNKSTVPVGTGREVAGIIRTANPDADFDIASNPEFLREGSAIGDFMRPDRVVVGAESARAHEIMREVYRPLYLRETPILATGPETAEMIKYASNAFLAMKISYINQMADLCEAVGADVHGVAKGMGLDGRIGAKFLHPGPGYGGSCFPKDGLALAKTADDAGVPLGLVAETTRYNNARKAAMAGRIIKAAGGDIAGKTIAMLGLAFKPETDDMRDSPALDIIPALLAAGGKLKAYDPAAMEQARGLLPGDVVYCDDAWGCIRDADITVVLTEWNEFRAMGLGDMASAMRGRVLVDLRNIHTDAAARAAGLDYHSIGRPAGAGI